MENQNRDSNFAKKQVHFFLGVSNASMSHVTIVVVIVYSGRCQQHNDSCFQADKYVTAYGHPVPDILCQTR